MKTKYILKGLIATLLLAFAISGCESFNEELLDGIGASREFSPLGITTAIRTQTTVELNWTTKEEADHYVVEFSADDADFKTIFKTVEVTAKQLPVKVQLEGETTYSIRIKAVSASGLADSKWSLATATTLSEQLFLPVQPVDIEAKQVTLKWVPNSNVTQITLAPGSITHTVTAQEKTAGVAVITGLTAETAYTATLFNAAKKRGVVAFTTGIDIGTGILVKNTDDLMQKIADAASGAILVLEPGDYAAVNQTGAITLNKSITLRGLRSYDTPKLHVNFVLTNGTANLSLIDLDLKGDKGAAAAAVSVIKYNDNSITYGSLLISNCNIHDYGISLISANLTAAKITSIIVENTIVTNVLTNGGEFIDFRGSHLGQLTLKNSTFNNCATARYFIRMDVGLTGLTANILIDACTISNPNMLGTAANAILYTRFVSNVITVRKTLFANTPAPYTRETATSNPAFSGNNYFNSPNLNGNPNLLANNRPDGTGTALDPQFEGAATGNFKIKNQTLIDNQVGDPRWRQ